MPLNIDNPYLYLFANDKDIYLTEHLLVTDIFEYIYLKMKKDYEHVFFFFRLTKNKTEIVCKDGNAASKYYHFSPGSYNPFKPSEKDYKDESNGGRKRFVFKQKNSTVRKVVNKLLKEEKDKYLFVFPLDVFVNIYDSEEYRKEFSLNVDVERYASNFIFLEKDIYRKNLPSLVPRKDDNNSTHFGALEKEMKVIWYPFEKRQIERMFLRNRLNYPTEYLSKMEERSIDDLGLHIIKKISNQDNNILYKNVIYSSKKDFYEHISKKENFLELIR